MTFIMRLLVFEFITGGGLVNEPLPDSLAQEGNMMRAALLQDLESIKDVSLIVLNDLRISEPEINSGILLHIEPGINLQSYLSDIKESYDVVWLIAPETECILLNWNDFFIQQNKPMCLSASDALALCQNKLQTVEHLQRANISCVPSQSYDSFVARESGEWVLKPMDSVACEQVYLLRKKQDWIECLKQLSKVSTYLLQPYIDGRAMSLSALFYAGEATLICCNQQNLSLIQNQFQLTECIVNVQQDRRGEYQALCSEIAAAIPGLWGYIGIDFIETEMGEMFILEINPRLTTSYVGIRAATGLNVAEHVLGLLDEKTPNLYQIKSETINVKIH